MPELPEAETIARQLHARLAGACFGEVRTVRTDMVHGDPRPLRRTLPGWRIDRVRRTAKRVILDLQGGGDASSAGALVFGLGMTGRLMVCAAEEPVEKHTHLRVSIAETGNELRFRDPRRFGAIWFLIEGRANSGRPLGAVGPEPLEIKPPEFLRLLRRKRAIKSLLLDQATIAGLGNIYCDESLFAAGIHPVRPANSLSDDEAKLLLRAIKATLRRAIKFNGSTLMDYRSADGEPGSFQRFHRVYNCGGEPCCACGTRIERMVVAGRSSWFCPRCQRHGGAPRRANPATKRP